MTRIYACIPDIFCFYLQRFTNFDTTSGQVPLAGAALLGFLHHEDVAGLS